MAEGARLLLGQEQVRGQAVRAGCSVRIFDDPFARQTTDLCLFVMCCCGHVCAELPCLCRATCLPAHVLPYESNMAVAQALFFLLSVTFFLLSAGETHPIVHKVSPMRDLGCVELLFAVLSVRSVQGLDCLTCCGW